MLESTAKTLARLHGKERLTLHFYPVVVEAEYRLRVRDTPIKAHTRTVRLSSSVVILELEESFAIGQPIELSIAWPVALNERVGLRLWIRGLITEVRAEGVAVLIQRHEFRTRLRPLEGTAAAQTASETRVAGPAPNVVEMPRNGLPRSMSWQDLQQGRSPSSRD